MWTLKRNDTNERTYKTEGDWDLKNELMVARGKDEGKGQIRSLVWTCTYYFI